MQPCNNQAKDAAGIVKRIWFLWSCAVRKAVSQRRPSLSKGLVGGSGV